MAELYIEERIASLSLAGDAAGVERFVQIAMRLAQLRQGERQ